MNMMTWIDIIPLKNRQEMMDHEYLKSYADEWTWELAIVEPVVIREIYKQLPLRTQLVLHTLLEGKGAVITEEYILVNKLMNTINLSGLQCKLALQQLAELGIIFVFHQPWQERVWQIPFPIFVQWNHHVLQQQTNYWKEQNITSYSQAIVYDTSQISLGRQMLYFFVKLQQVDMTFTRKGILCKATIDQLNRQSLLDEALLSNWLGSYLKQADYSAYIMLMLELANALGIISSTNEGLKYDWHKLLQWLSLSEWQRERQLMQLVFEVCLCETSYEVVVGPIGVIASLQPGIWYEATSQAASQKDGQLALWLSVCSHFGWLQWMSKEQSTFIRLQSFSFEAAKDIAIQDNGEIIVMPDVNFVLLWHLEHMAERISNQEVTVYRLTTKKLSAALLTSYQFEHLKELLTYHHNGELPSLVNQMLDEVKTYETHGSQPRIPLYMAQQYVMLQPLTLTQWGKWLSMPKVAFYKYELFNLELDIISDLIDTEQITKSWYMELRPYHPSTSRKIVEYAIEHEMSLQLVSEGISKRYIPKVVIEELNQWQVEGVFELQPNDKRIMLCPKDWSAIKLDFH